jgi:isopenicillin-N N-acyltransferase-like protein
MRKVIIMPRHLRTTGFPPGFWFAAVFVTSAVAALATAQPKQEAVRAFAPATVIEGTPQDRGRAYGARFREAIRDFLTNEIEASFVGKPATKEQMLQYAAACGKVVRAECPLVADEFQGIADGAGLTFDEIVLINLHEELYHRTDLPKQGHCTAVAVSPSDTGDKHTYVGQTWDWMPSVAGKSCVLEWRRAEGVSILAYGFPGMPMGAGMNAEGIALCWTSANLGNKGQTPRVGIPSYMLIAHLLAQKNLDAVEREARKNKHAGWFTFVMADGHGRLVNIEGSPERVVVEEADGRLARVMYGSRELAGGKLHARCQLMYDLLRATQGKNGLTRLKDYFADPKYQINAGKGTIDMMVFDTTARTAHLSRGTSYKVSWREFGFGAKQ